MQTERWHQELDRFLDIKTTFLLEGNVYDLHAYPTKSDEGIRWDMLLMDQYLYRFLKDHGYQTIVFYQPVDGFYNPFDKESLEAFLKAANATSGRAQDHCYMEPVQSADMIRTALAQAEEPVAVVMMLASRYMLSASSITAAERDFYTRLMLTSLHKQQVKTERGFVNNLLFLVCEKANDVPTWFYLENPFVKSLIVSVPEKEERRMFIDTQQRFWTVFNSEEDLEMCKQQFVDLTAGMQNLELNALRQLSKREQLPLTRIKDAIQLYKYGTRDNPWDHIPEERLEKAEDFIRKRVKGQDQAVEQTLDILKRAVCGMAGLQHSGGAKPKGILFFAGPTGTGKTELAKTIAELLFGDEDACIRFDMSEYQQSHSDQKLLGAPPGYVGYEAGGQLTNAVKNKPFSILLFDEVEKAHPSIFDKFLQILEDGRMTDGRGETVYFSETIIIFTSNLGIYDMDEHGQRHRNVSSDMTYDELRQRLIDSISSYFKLQLGRPEILNRIGDNIVVFDFIREDVADQILSTQLTRIFHTLEQEKNIHVTIDEQAHSELRAKAFDNLENGGRGIGNIVESQLINPLARFLFDHHVKEGSTVRIDRLNSGHGLDAHVEGSTDERK